MKKIIITALIASMLVVGMTACGKQTNDYTSDERVLYSDSDTSSDSDSENADAESKEESESKKEGDEQSKDSSSSKGTESKKTVSLREATKPVAPKKTESKSTASQSTQTNPTTPRTTTSQSTATTASKSETSSADETSSKASSSESSSSKLTDTDTDTETDTLTDTETDTESDTDTSSAPSDPFDEDEDLVFSYSGNYFWLYMEIDDIIDTLGIQPDSINEVGMSETGSIKEYSYDDLGFSFTAHPTSYDEDVYVVDSIHLTSSSVGTEKDISVGSPEEMIYSVYGEDDCVYSYGTYKYNSDDFTRYLEFSVENGVVSEIVIGVNSSLF